MALGLISFRLGRDASEVEQHQTMALVALATPLGEAESGLGLWAAYGAMHLQSEAGNASPRTVSDERAVDTEPHGNDVRLRRPDVSVPIVERSVGLVDWRVLVEQYGDWDWNVVARIIGCESGGSTTVVSRTGDVGLMQVNLVHGYSISQLQDPAFNVRVGHDLWLDGGYTPWVSSSRCWA